MPKVVDACIALAMVMAIGAASANQDQPASQRSLPGDNLPPFGMTDTAGHLPSYLPAPPVGFHHGGSGTPVESTARGPTLEIVIAAARAAVNNCTSRGYRGATTVIDTAEQARERVPKDSALVARMKSNMFVQFGGFPVTDGDEVIGAIGNSGGDDEACAKAGLDEIQRQLKKTYAEALCDGH